MMIRSVATALSLLVLLGPGSPAGAYVRPGRTAQVDLTDTGEQRSGDAGFSSIDAHARFVAFDSLGGFASIDVNQLTDVYLRDLRRKTTKLISSSATGLPAIGVGAANGPPGASPKHLSWDPSISADGRYAAFTSLAANLVPGDTNAASDVFVFDAKLGVTRRISAGSSGIEVLPRTECGITPAHSWAPSISANGRYVAFLSAASGLTDAGIDSGEPLDALGSDCIPGVYVHDQVKRLTRLVSVSTEGEAAFCSPEDNCNALWLQRVNAVAISGSGQVVAFDSEAANLVEGDTNTMRDVFVHDVEKGTTERVSISSQGDQTPAGQWSPTPGIYSALSALPVNAAGRSLSHDGRFVLFYSNAYGLVPADAPANPTSVHGDYFVHDRKSHRTERVSVDLAGRQMMLGQGWDTSSISADGRYVSMALRWRGFPDDYNAERADFVHAYVHDRWTGGIDMIARTDAGGEALDCRGESVDPTANADWSEERSPDTWNGRFVSFQSCATNLQERSDPAAAFHVFVRDQGIPLGAQERARSSVSAGVGKGFNRNGIVQLLDRRGDEIAASHDLIGASDLLGMRIALRPQHRDLYVALDLADLQPAVPVLFGFRMTVDEKEFEIRAMSSPLQIGGLSGRVVMFDCSSDECVEVSGLAGGVGTAGDVVTISVPLDRVGLDAGGRIDEVLAFSALGTIDAGARHVLDVIRGTPRYRREELR